MGFCISLHSFWVKLNRVVGFLHNRLFLLNKSSLLSSLLAFSNFFKSINFFYCGICWTEIFLYFFNLFCVIYFTFLWRSFCSFLTAVTWNGIECRLTLHWENGFLLTRAKTDTETESVLWSNPYEKLRSSSDDAKRLLWLDFGENEGEQVRIIFFSKFVV